MKKLFSYSLSLLSGVLALSLSGCSAHHHDCAPLDEVVGIYQLTTLSWNDLEDPNIQINEIETYHAKGYLVVTGEQYGYAYYKDDENAERFSFINLQYGPDEEKQNMYTYVKYSWEYSSGHCRNTMYHPGYDEPQLGVQRKSHKLTYTSPKQQKNIFDSSKGYYNRVYVEYTRISDKTSFTDFKQTTGLDLAEPVLPEIPQE